MNIRRSHLLIRPLSSSQDPGKRVASRCFLFVVLFAAASLFVLPDRLTPKASTATAKEKQANKESSMPTLRGEEAVEHLKQRGSYNSLQEAMAAVRYEAKWQAKPLLAGVGAAHELANRPNNLLAYVTPEGVELTSLVEPQKGWRLGLKLRGLGYAANLSAVAAGEVKATANRVEIHRPLIVEWYENTARGIEQGFDIGARPGERKAGEPLRLRFEVSGDTEVRVDGTGRGAAFIGAAGEVLVGYRKLFVTDAKGRAVEARMTTERGGLEIEVEDEEAEYPLRIDPLFELQKQLTALVDGAANDRFGQSVAISGETVVVGAPLDDIGANADQGSAYVFVRSGALWSLPQKLTASDGAAGDSFGESVAISGDTVVVGARSSDIGANANQGSVYVFVRSGTTWTQQQKLTATDGGANDQFGVSVAISDDTVVVGDWLDDVGTNTDQGSAYVFLRIGTNWIQQGKLTASDGAAGDHFGFSVAISGDTVVVGAPDTDIGLDPSFGSAYVYVRSGMTWTQQQKLTAFDATPSANFGTSVAISGDTLVIGSGEDVPPDLSVGAAYVFVRSGTTWNEQQKIVDVNRADLDAFGSSVAISGDTIVVGEQGDDIGPDNMQGSAFVFVRSGTTWIQQLHLSAPDGAAGDRFGNSVAFSGDTIVVGAFLDDVGTNTDQGSAYVFVCSWVEQAHPLASDGTANDVFGQSVAISGNTAVVGATGDDVGAITDQGSAYVFVRSGAFWSQQQKLTASDGAAGDQFGYSVSISGDTVIVGVRLDDVGANSDQGSAYVFVRSGTTWTQQQKLTASDGAAGDNFGISVSISSDTVVVGSWLDTVGANPVQGSAYVYVRSGATWSEQQKLTASDGAVGDNFGISVAISGDTVVVGAYFDDVGATADQGSAYVFVRSGTTWTQQQRLTAADGAANDRFGNSVAISGETVVVGANFVTQAGNVNVGQAYVFVRSGTTWTQQTQLVGSNATAGAQFGFSVSISSNGTIVVGAFLDELVTNSRRGSAYVFVKSGTNWIQQGKLTASDGATNDQFGNSVAISSDGTIVVGARSDDVGANANQGSVYIFFLGCNTPPEIVASVGITRQKGSAPTNATIATVDDVQDPIGYLTVSVASAPAGITISNIVNTNGVITAMVGASCGAALGNNVVILQVEDSDGAVGSAQLLINVTANNAPTLGIYPNTTVAVLGATTVTPSVIPADNGSIVSFSATSPTYTGISSVNLDTGVVTLTNARPSGTHLFTVTAVDNCGITTTSGFRLTVTCQSITVNPATIPAATAGSPYNQVFTQTGGNGTVTFSLTGALPTGLSFTAATATLSGTPTQVGSYPITVTATDENNCSGSRNYTLVVNAALLVWNGSTNSDWHTASNWTPNAVPTAFHDVLIPSSGVTNEPTIANNSSAINAMTVQSGRVLTINSSRQLSTASDVTTGGQIGGAGTLLFDGSTFTQNGSVSVASVQFDAGTHTLTGGGSFASNIITVLNGASVTLISSHSVSVIVINSGGTFDATNQTLTLTGAGTPIFNSGTFTATSSTLIYQGSVAQVVTANIAYNNLTINNAAGVSLAGDTTVTGVLNLLTDLTTGIFTLTMPALGSSTGAGDVIGNILRTGFTTGSAALSFGNPDNTIQFTSGTAPSDVLINLVKSPPGGFPNNTVSRTYTITPTGGSGFSATLRLRYKDSELNGVNEATLELWRFNGSAWQSPAGTASHETTSNWVEETSVTQFSPWAIAGPAGPTLVQLISFTATAYDSGTLLEWQTGLEVDNLGFTIHRDEDGKLTSVNRELIAGSAFLVGTGTALGSGHSYLWWDERTVSKATKYWLEDKDLHGVSRWQGPFYVSDAPDPNRPAQIQLARTLTALTAVASPSTPVQSHAAIVPFTAAGLQAQALVLNSPQRARLTIKQEGWYQITASELAAAGFDTQVDPHRLRLFVDGKPQAILVTGEKDDRFDADDAVEFYGSGTASPYADSRTYFLIAAADKGERITRIKSAAAPDGKTGFPFTVERRDRSVYFAALKNGERENFFGAVIASQEVNQSLTLPHVDAAASGMAMLDVSLQGVTQVNHTVAVRLNGNDLGLLTFNGQALAEKSFPIPHTLVQEGDNQVTLAAQGGAADVSLVDTIRLTYQHTFRADDDALRLTLAAPQGIALGGFSNEQIRVFDVTDPQATREIEGEIVKAGDGSYEVALRVPGEGPRQLLALTQSRSRRVASLASKSTTAWSGYDGADFIILTQRDFFAAAEGLRAVRQRQGLAVAMIDITDIYDEFGYGQKAPQAIRDFLAAATRWQRPARYVLFFGDASFDPKNYLGLGEGDLVPTKLIETRFLETASDDWLADFNGDGASDLAIGRLPARDAEEATRLIAKVLSYEQSQPVGEALFVSDSNDGFDFAAANAQLIRLLPPEVQAKEVRRGELGDQAARAEVLTALNLGPRLINYAGHGSVTAWRGNLLMSGDARGLENQAHLSVFVMMNCLNGYFHDPASESLAESLLRGSTGGAVAVWASSALTFANEQMRINQEFYRQVFERSSGGVRIGDAARRAKGATRDEDVRRTWILLADPTMSIK